MSTDYKETKAWKIATQQKEEVNEKLIQLRIDNLKLRYKELYNKTKGKLYSAEEREIKLLSKQMDIESPETTVSDLETFFEAKYTEVEDFKATLKMIKADYKDMFSEEIE